MNHKRNYGYGGHGKKWQSSSQNREKHRQQSVGYDDIKRTFEEGNFSEVRGWIRDKEKRKALESLYRGVKSRAKEFPKWDEQEVLRNAAIIAAHSVSNDLRTTQIRKIIEITKNLHTNVKGKNNESISTIIKKDAVRMNMLMAYYAGKNESVLPLQEVLEPILNWLSQDENATPENFEKVYTFFEAIVAYHKYFGGKE